MAAKKILENYRGFDDGLSYLTGVSDLSRHFFLDIKKRMSYTNFNQGGSLAIDDEFLKRKELPQEAHFRL